MTAFRITLAQINPTIGDLAGNLALMRQAAAQAAAERAQMVVFPELSLTGYLPGDLLDEVDFLARCDRALENWRQHFGDARAVLGGRRADPAHGPGKALEKQPARPARRGGRAAVRQELLPPTTSSTSTATSSRAGCRSRAAPGRHPGRFPDLRGRWNDDGDSYAVNPFARLATRRPTWSSRSTPARQCRQARAAQRLFAAASRRHQLPVVYVNQVGGHDQLVFDGASFAVTPAAGVVFEAARFAEAVTTLQLADGRFLAADGAALPPVPSAGLPVMEFYRRQIVLGLRDYARRCGFRQAVVGSSGGIDSALTLALAVEALGADNVVAITMPSRFSSSGSVDDSALLCRNLGIKLHEHPIRAIVGQYEAGFAETFGQPLRGLALENLQARVRGTLLMEFSNSYGHLLLTTGNKSEISVGYCTLYGDTNGGLGLIGDLYKTEVFDLSRHLNTSAGRELIPVSIIDKEPSAELAPDQRDSDSLPPYPSSTASSRC